MFIANLMNCWEAQTDRAVGNQQPSPVTGRFRDQSKDVPPSGGKREAPVLRAMIWSALQGNLKQGENPGQKVTISGEHKGQEGGAIPVGSVSLGSTILNRYKLAEILVTTMELKERAIVDIEALFRRAMLASYSKVLDNALLSAGGAVAGVRPAGLLNGITVVAGDATGGLASVTADIMAMEGELLAINQGAVPVLLLNNRNRRALGFVTSALGEFVFQAQLASGQIFEVAIVASANVPYNTAVMVDASSLAMVLDAPMFDISQVATVVMSNADTTAPTMADDGSGAVGNAGEVQDGIQVKPAGATVPVHAAGYEARSMFQTLTASIASFCGNAVDQLCELLENPSRTISSQAA